MFLPNSSNINCALAWKCAVIKLIDTVLFTHSLKSRFEDKLTSFGLQILDMQAKSEAAKQGKWLLVNLQSTTEFASYMVRT